MADKKIARYLPENLADNLASTGRIAGPQNLLIGVVDSVTTALDAKSAWTKGHSSRVAKMAADIGNALKLDEDELYDLKLAALFHDVGKIGTYDQILDKPGKLDDKEMELIRRHPGKTHEILSPIGELSNVAHIALHHHERWDGNGYPGGVRGDDIPYLSRILTVADCYDAMKSDRPYRRGLSDVVIRQELRRESGTQFDPVIVAIFMDILENASRPQRTLKPAARRKRRRPGKARKPKAA